MQSNILPNQAHSMLTHSPKHKKESRNLADQALTANLAGANAPYNLYMKHFFPKSYSPRNMLKGKKISTNRSNSNILRINNNLG